VNTTVRFEHTVHSGVVWYRELDTDVSYRAEFIAEERHGKVTSCDIGRLCFVNPNGSAFYTVDAGVLEKMRSAVKEELTRKNQELAEVVGSLHGIPGEGV
jgi:hypothetical protein